MKQFVDQRRLSGICPAAEYNSSCLHLRKDQIKLIVKGSFVFVCHDSSLYIRVFLIQIEQDSRKDFIDLCIADIFWKNIGFASRMFAILAKEGIHVRMIDAGFSEMNVIIGISAPQYEKAFRALYDGLQDLM